MKILRRKRGRPAFTMVEMFIVIAVLAIIAALVLPALRHAKPKIKRGSCTNNLKQVGSAFKTWATDHNDLFPVEFYTNQSGGMLYADGSNFFRYFQCLSNELNNYKILICPADSNRSIATGWATNFSGANISYFIGLDANQLSPATILSGDRNITNGTKLINGVLYLSAARPFGWTAEQHNGGGNILFADGSVQQVNSIKLAPLMLPPGLVTNRLAMP